MKSFLRSLSLLLAGALATHLAYCYYFNLPININPITVLNIGDGKVEIDNRVNQGAPPAPSPSPATPPAPAPTPEPPPKAAERAPEQSVPRQPEVAEAERGRSEEATPEATPIRRRAPQQVMAHAPDFEVQPRPVYTNYVQPTPVRRRACPTVIARRPPPEYDEEEEEFEPQPVYPGRVHSRSHSSSVVTVNGRVVSSSSVITVNGRVVSRSEYPPPPDDDDNEW